VDIDERNNEEEGPMISLWATTHLAEAEREGEKRLPIDDLE